MPAPACYSNIPNGLMGVLAGSTLSNTGYSGGIPVDFSPSQGIGECRQCKGDTRCTYAEVARFLVAMQGGFATLVNAGVAAWRYAAWRRNEHAITLGRVVIAYRLPRSQGWSVG